MAGRDDLLGVDSRPVLTGEQAIERKPEVADAFDRLALLRCIVQPADEAERIAEPDGARSLPACCTCRLAIPFAAKWLPR